MDVESLVQSLSIEEKISFLVGAGVSRKIPGAAGDTRAIERLGIPSIVLSDGPAGVRISPIRVGQPSTYFATAFPNEILLASTWSPDVVEKVGRAVADIILGSVSPSGKLPLTWPQDLYETPAMRSFPGIPKHSPQYVVYEEDIYVGYRYCDTFSIEPAYEFGYGLSYTKFEYSNLKVFRDSEKVKVVLKVRDVGQYPGKEVVQVYVRAPKGKLNKPFQELKGFYKTKTLKPGEEEEVVIEMPVKHFSQFQWF